MTGAENTADCGSYRGGCVSCVEVYTTLGNAARGRGAEAGMGVRGLGVLFV